MAEQQYKNSNSPPSPSMTNAQQKNGPFRQQAVGYPSPTYGDSPCLSQFSYPPPVQPGPEPYRESPPGSNGSRPLPSMRSLDPLQQKQQQQQMGSNIPPPVAQMGGRPYYQQPGQGVPPYPNVTTIPNGQNINFALPATESRQVGGGRHKKEIKRRTKTGCLTCRKRRIKCDEQHPACRNCQKSKRECLGYDPIFKQQPGPTAIQPAPSSTPSVGSILVSSNPYGSQPHILSGGYGATNMACDPALPAGPLASGQGFDYTSAIDPALEGTGPVSAPGVYPTSLPEKQTVSDLLSIGGPAPPRAITDITSSSTLLDEIKHLYYSIYTPGLENFLETKWFSVKGLAKLLESKSLLEQFASLIQQFAKTNQNDPKEIQYTSNVEARVVWALAGMVRSTVAEMNALKEIKTVPSINDPLEATNRLNVFETLLTGRVAAINPLTAPLPGSTDHHRLRELEFWYTLGSFVCLPYEDTSAAKDVDETLAALRNLLDGRENRDVLYSIAVARGLGQRVSEYTENDAPLHLDESDNKSKLLVAKKFVADEAAGAGTTNVIRRLCDLASRSWAVSAPK
ncbi:putative protein/C6 finger domain protein [Golovinomyces cichoracearum]|uniref:Zn(2)-C6 fungal-type domain-containing protein n=1 Tax=Golovinomyces cichoracearum TaxID=62708 RepID=A0A420HBY6_9PEZI|nr:putative protein/C6 finger domain protein [Golovinomyces cichoracearum]